MGIDIEIWVLGTCTDEELQVAEEFVMNRAGGLSWGTDRTILRRQNYPEDRIAMDSGDRFYGEGYERGNWPEIYGGIRAMQAAFPGRSVYYGGDTDYYGEECAPEMLERIWRHWMSPSGDAYHARARNEEYEAKRRLGPPVGTQE